MADLNLTPLGTVHTLLSVVAVVTALAALVIDGRIARESTIGRTYLLFLLLCTVTGLPIFRHGTVGPAHVIGVITLVLLVVATAADRSRAFGDASVYVATVSYSATVLLVMITAVTETLTRVPVSGPLVASQDAPVLKELDLALFVTFLVVAALQVRALRAAPGAGKLTAR
jgi:hypothetical protein